VTDLAASSASVVVPGILGFLVVAALAVALFFLLRSMNKQLGKVVTGPKWREGGQPGPAASQASQTSQDSRPGGSAGA
jgi:hypothetical protein